MRSLTQPEGDEVHVWEASLDVGAGTLDRLVASLSSDERERMARFRFERHRRRYGAARGILRTILGGYLGEPARRSEFDYSPFGKPRLREPDVSRTLDFNVSHSEDVALAAFTAGRDVGVDVEKVEPRSAAEEVWRNYFSPAEIADLRSLGPDDRVAAFFRAWTRKEALLKGLGEGLSLALDSFDVTCLPGAPARLLATRFDESAVERWHLAELDAPPGFAAALAVHGGPPVVRRFAFTHVG